MKYIKEFFKKHNLSVIIVMAFIFGLGGGLIGTIASRAYLVDSLLGFSPFGSLDFSTGRYADQGLIISNAKNVIVQQDTKVDETISSVGSSLVGIYKKPPSKADKPKLIESSKVFQLENFYKMNEPSGQGFIISSDGWIATSLTLVKTYNDYVVITKDKKIYQIDQAVADSLTGFNFIHVQARDLSVRKFAEKKYIKGGSLAVAVNWLGFSMVSSVAGFSEPSGLVKSSDNFSQKLILNDKPSAELRGLVIFNLAGEALGLVDSKGEIEPIDYLSGAIKSLFKNKNIIRPSLGVNYIELAELDEINGQNSNWQKGVIIYRNDKSVAVEKNSAADKAGLREGDIIISIDDVDLDKDNALADIIQGHLIGDAINLVILRNGQEKEVKVTLGKGK